MSIEKINDVNQAILAELENSKSELLAAIKDAGVNKSLGSNPEVYSRIGSYVQDANFPRNFLSLLAKEKLSFADCKLNDEIDLNGIIQMIKAETSKEDGKDGNNFELAA
ncbi:MAG: hypothetical protein PHT51_00105 [Patescibacteria group bacterium]|nr:hypothetical protein [Patescibacteria group bacterium]MDD4610636.1 hypothetical protein [Patescibacteria group bacterium]